MSRVDWTNVTTPSNLLAVPNSSTGGWFWTTMLYTAVIIMIMSFIQFGLEVALLVSLFIGILLGMFLFYLGLISGTWLGVLVASELFVVIYVIAMSYKNQ